MALTKYTQSTDVILNLGTDPEDRPDMDDDDLKSKFDENAKKIVAFLNNTLTEEVEQIVSTMNLIFTNKVVATTDFVADATYTDYGYKAVIICAGVTTSYKGDIIFNVAEATSGIYAPVCLTGAGNVTIYASEVPSADITIPTIVCTKAVS